MEEPAVLAEIAELADRRHRDPAQVLQRVEQLVAATTDSRVQAAGSLAAGLALQELGRIKEAAASLRKAVEIAGARGFPHEEALARAQLAISLLNLGDAGAAEREVIRARSAAPETAFGMVEMLYGLVLQRTGRHEHALAAYRRALRALERAGDLTSVARLRLNRGIVFAYKGELDAALEDLREAERIAVAHDLPLLKAMAAHNVGFAHGRRGNLPEALGAYDRAKGAYEALESPHRLLAVLQADRCQILLLAGLVADARAAAEAGVGALELVGDRAHLTESRLLLARALLAEGAYEAATAQANLAARGFKSAGWMPWVALARYVAVQADVLALQEDGPPPPALLRRCQRIAAELETQGWPVEALHVRTFVGRMALALGRPAVARAELAQAAGARRRGTAELRAQAWHATALLRLADDDKAGAKRALARGIAVVDEYRATLGATEMRANASSHSADLARVGIGLALTEGRPLEVLRWAERWRAGALRTPPVCPPADERLAAQLAELRRVRTELVESSLRGQADTSQRARVAALEEELRDQARRRRDDGGSAAGRIDVTALRAALGDQVLVEYVAIEQRLHAVTLAKGRARLYDLGPTDRIEHEKAFLLFALHRLLAGRPRGTVEHALGFAADRLDRLLLAPLGLDLAAPMVIVPTGILHGLPWSALPSLAGRTTTIAPSAALWLGAGRAVPPPGTGRITLVAGPHLPGAEAEVRALATLYPEAEVLAGADATALAVIEQMGRADLVHLAAHGHFRADSPLFSSVLLADGPLTIYDLERVQRPPGLVVLSACDAAVADVRTGDELLGTATALIGLGVPCVIAAVLPVSDAATVAPMVELHTRLAAGERPAAALAHAVAAQDDPAAAAAFICIGTRDDSPVG